MARTPTSSASLLTSAGTDCLAVGCRLEYGSSGGPLRDCPWADPFVQAASLSSSSFTFERKTLHKCIGIGNVFSDVADLPLSFACRTLGHFQITLSTHSAPCKRIELGEITFTFLERHLLQDLTTDGGYWSITPIKVMDKAQRRTIWPFSVFL